MMVDHEFVRRGSLRSMACATEISLSATLASRVAALFPDINDDSSRKIFFVAIFSKESICVDVASAHAIYLVQGAVNWGVCWYFGLINGRRKEVLIWCPSRSVADNIYEKCVKVWENIHELAPRGARTSVADQIRAGLIQYDDRIIQIFLPVECLINEAHYEIVQAYWLFRPSPRFNLYVPENWLEQIFCTY